MSKTAFLFPGQGAQKAGMGADFYENSRLAREVYDEASANLGLDMKRLCFEENDRLDRTEYTQAALAATCLAMAETVLERGVMPDVTAGLSLGEYCAIAVAGGMRRQDAIGTVRKRGILMQEAVPLGGGSMAAVLGLTGEKLEEMIAGMEGVFVANYNCPGQLVITGETQAVKEAGAKLLEGGARRVIPLKVSGPFHSPLLKPAGEALLRVLEQVPVSPLAIPYVTNVTADYVTEIGQIKALLSQQVAAPVRWQQSMERMLADGVDTFVEIGPGRTLAGFLRKMNRNVQIYNISTWEEMERAAEKLTGE